MGYVGVSPTLEIKVRLQISVKLAFKKKHSNFVRAWIPVLSLTKVK